MINVSFTDSKMCIVFVCMRFVKDFGCRYNQSGLLKIEIIILLRLARFQNLETPPSGKVPSPSASLSVYCVILIIDRINYYNNEIIVSQFYCERVRIYY